MIDRVDVHVLSRKIEKHLRVKDLTLYPFQNVKPSLQFDFQFQF